MASFGPLSQLLVKSIYINVLSALKWQASLNSSLDDKITVDSVKMTIFEVILPHRKGLIAIGAIGLLELVLIANKSQLTLEW